MPTIINSFNITSADVDFDNGWSLPTHWHGATGTGYSFVVKGTSLFLIKYDSVTQTATIKKIAVTLANYEIYSGGVFMSDVVNGFFFLSMEMIGTGPEFGNIVYALVKVAIPDMTIATSAAYGPFLPVAGNGWTNSGQVVANANSVFVYSRSASINYLVELIEFSALDLSWIANYSSSYSGFYQVILDDNFMFLDVLDATHKLVKVDLSNIPIAQPKIYYTGNFNGGAVTANYSGLAFDGSLWVAMRFQNAGASAFKWFKVNPADWSFISGQAYQGSPAGATLFYVSPTHLYVRDTTREMAKINKVTLDVEASFDQAGSGPCFGQIIPGDQLLVRYEGFNYTLGATVYGWLVVPDTSLLLLDNYFPYFSNGIGRFYLTDFVAGIHWIDFDASYSATGYSPPATDITGVGVTIEATNFAAAGGAQPVYPGLVVAVDSLVANTKLGYPLYLMDIQTGNDAHYHPSTQEIHVTHHVLSAPPAPLRLYLMFREGANPYDANPTNYSFSAIAGFGDVAAVIPGVPPGNYHVNAFLLDWNYTFYEHTGVEVLVANLTLPTVQTNPAVVA